MNPYQVLGVPQEATQDEIKKAYRRLAKQYHPDRNKSKAAEVIIVRVNEAYEILSDPVKKARYDQPYQTFYTQTDEEHLYEERKRAFRKRKWEEAQRAEAKREKREKLIYKIMRVLAFPCLAFAMVLVVDEWLPVNTYVEIADRGWQVRGPSGRSGRQGILSSYMQTPNFVLSVPNEVHLDYDYFGKPGPIKIEATPILKIPRFIEVITKKHLYVFDAAGTIYSILLPLHYIMLLSAGYVVYTRRYSKLSYSLCFLPIMLLLIIVVFQLN